MITPGAFFGWGLLCFALTSFACSHPETEAEERQATPLIARTDASVTIVARTDVLPTYPCTQCHNERRPPRPEARELHEIHTRIRLDHATRPDWCYSCHALGDMNQLVLPGGERVSFDASYRLCGSCHGEKLSDWRQNLHGLTTGYWNGPTQRRTCTACHDPHAPRTTQGGWSFPLMKPRPPPRHRILDAPGNEHDRAHLRREHLEDHER